MQRLSLFDNTWFSLYEETRDNTADRDKWSYIDLSVAAACNAQVTESGFFANNSCSPCALLSLYMQDPANPEALMAVTNTAF